MTAAIDLLQSYQKKISFSLSLPHIYLLFTKKKKVSYAKRYSSRFSLLFFSPSLFSIDFLSFLYYSISFSSFILIFFFFLCITFLNIISSAVCENCETRLIWLTSKLDRVVRHFFVLHPRAFDLYFEMLIQLIRYNFTTLIKNSCHVLYTIHVCIHMCLGSERKYDRR